jgi:hypothetical protein
VGGRVGAAAHIWDPYVLAHQIPTARTRAHDQPCGDSHVHSQHTGKIVFQKRYNEVPQLAMQAKTLIYSILSFKNKCF